jgi:hypothetical protein
MKNITCHGDNYKIKDKKKGIFYNLHFMKFKDLE